MRISFSGLLALFIGFTLTLAQQCDVDSDDCIDVIIPTACYNEFGFRSLSGVLGCIDGKDNADRTRKVRDAPITPPRDHTSSKDECLALTLRTYSPLGMRMLWLRRHPVVQLPAAEPSLFWRGSPCCRGREPHAAGWANCDAARWPPLSSPKTLGKGCVRHFWDKQVSTVDLRLYGFPLLQPRSIRK